MATVHKKRLQNRVDKKYKDDLKYKIEYPHREVINGSGSLEILS